MPRPDWAARFAACHAFVERTRNADMHMVIMVGAVMRLVKNADRARHDLGSFSHASGIIDGKRLQVATDEDPENFGLWILEQASDQEPVSPNIKLQVCAIP